MTTFEKVKKMNGIKKKVKKMNMTKKKNDEEDEKLLLSDD